MKLIQLYSKYIPLLFILAFFGSCKNSQENKSKENFSWKAQWIVPKDQSDSVNVWMNFRKEVKLKTPPTTPLIARIAVDSKYWLWINKKMVIREGGLKRGPTPTDTYYDEVDVSKYLKKGKNTIAVLVQYFGKNGFSHKSSGQGGLLFDLQGKDLDILSNASWKAWLNPAFGETGPPHPNYRLPESNIHFDARKGGYGFIDANFDDSAFPKAKAMGVPPIAPWNSLIERAIPQWKDFGLKEYKNTMDFPFISEGDTLKMKLPYNAQITPYLKLEASAGKNIDIRTDHYRGGGPPNVRGEYITKEGIQTYENLGWMNGEEVYYYIPKGVKVLNLAYRETGFDTNFAGSFKCNEDFYNRLWKKSLRTLYVTMRDTYMDCPDRERAQWWGDEVLESGESFYALDRKADALTKKGMLELVNWQRKDSSLFSPVPSGNWNKELPGQMLASVGYYGFYNYYLQTGDLETIKKVYPPVKKYLALWKLKKDGTVKIRQGGWIWGDWGKNKDVPILINTQYYLALKGQVKMAKALGKKKDIADIRQKMKRYKKSFNKKFWQADQYRSPGYKGKTDDRSQALAVVSGLADKVKFGDIYKVLQTQRHASPYMEKYVLEALFQMGHVNFALKRMKNRFSKMVDYPNTSTLWEGWGIGAEGYGGGTTNHAWSGGGLTLLSQYVAGVYPTSPGYRTFRIMPQLGFLKHVKTVVPSIRGNISVDIEVDNGYSLNVEVPKGTKATINIPIKYKNIKMNGKRISFETNGAFNIINVGHGKYNFKAI